MSMDFNDWENDDWGHADWNNGWTQSFNRQPPPKEQVSQNNRQNKVNHHTSAYFENSNCDNERIISQPHIAQSQTSYSLETINNNNTIVQTENREVAPPDNKQSYDTSQIFQNRQEPQQNRPNPFVSTIPQSSKHPSQQHNIFSNNVESSNISSYFESKPVNRMQSAPQSKPFYSQPTADTNMAQTLISGPVSYGENQTPHQQKMENEAQFASLGHQPNLLQQQSSHIPMRHPNSTSVQQNLSNVQFGQPNLFSHQQFSNQPVGQPLNEGQQHKSPPSLWKKTGSQEFLPNTPLEQSISKQQLSSNAPTGQQNIPTSSDINLAQQPDTAVVLQHPPGSVPFGVNASGTPPQQQMSSSEPEEGRDVSSLPNIPLTSQPHTTQQQSSNPPLFRSQAIGQQSVYNYSVGSQPISIQHQQPNQHFGPPSINEQQQLSSSNLGAQPVVEAQQSLPNTPGGQPAPSVQQHPSNIPQQTSGMQQHSSSPLFFRNQSVPEQQNLLHNTPLESQPPPVAGLKQSSSPPLASLSQGLQQHPPNIPVVSQAAGVHQHSSNAVFGVPPPNEENTITSSQHVENRLRFTPSPQQQQSFRAPNSQSQAPNVTNIQSQHLNLNSELQETNVHHHNSNQPSFPMSKINVHPPMATSSPLSNINQYPENQERIPDNKEYPDNTENIAQDLKALKINPSRDVEQESQKHCAIDRNQYLETGQFSAQKENNTYIQNFEVNDEGEAPPPGLHRLVTGQGYEPWKVEPESTQLPGQVGESTPGPGNTRHSSPLSSIGGESEGREEDKEGRREVPGEDEPLQGRVVLGQVPTPPQDAVTNRGERDRKRLDRMVVGEHGQSGGNTSDDYRQSGRPNRHSRHRRNDSSYEEEERDYSSDRDRRNEEHRRRDERTRRRREPRSPEYRSDEEYDNRRGYHRSGRDSRRMREYSPDRSYYRDYYREEDFRHSRHYYPREYDEVYYRENQRSRPSSRSGSDYRHPLKHAMRPIPSHHYYHDPYVSTPSFHDYNIKYSQRTVDYFERMRHADPAAYAAWYAQYMQGRFMQEDRTFSSDRASVHSGQSSSNQRHGVSTPQETVDDLNREEEEPDYTPRLFDSAHIRGNMDSHGRLIVVEPNYPLDQQKAIVNVCRLSQVSIDKDSEDFFHSPGPFIPGITHRNTVLQYLKRISDHATKSSEKLLYDLVHMTVKGNGEVNGSDVAELLMDSYKRSKQEERESSEERPNPVSEKDVIDRFRELLQQGNKAEALEWAMENGAWGHALFLASKMGERTHNEIMLRFANSVPHNDTLQTLYQLMSGYIPQAATCCADKKWSDWRPHLAMILSNPTGENLDRQSIITLGDSLNASGRLFASHFCYVTAQLEFTEFKPDAKLVLLGSSPGQDFSKFATCRAIMLTMCYEYGLKLRQPTFNIPTLQVYKLMLATRLIDSGRIRNALQYCELLAQETLGGSSPINKSLVATVIDLSSRLKMLDPVLALSGDTEKDPDWLSSLKQLHSSLPEEQVLSNSRTASPPAVPEQNYLNDIVHQELNYKVADMQSGSFGESGPLPQSMGVPTYPVHSQGPSNNITMYPVMQPHSLGAPQQQPQPSSSVPQLPPRTQAELSDDIYHPKGFNPPTIVSTPQHSSLGGFSVPHVPENGQALPGNIEINSGPESSWETRLPPQVIQQSSEPSQGPRNNFFKATEEQLKLNEVGGGDKKRDGKQPESKASTKSEEQSGGWFGGIWEKIALRPKNQMRLPDDSNPSIIWDEKKKKWVNLDGDNENSTSVKPPPKINEAPLPPQGNKYKIQKGKMMKSNYVDVMGNKEKTDPTQSNFIPSAAQPSAKPNFFIPPPVEGNENAPIDFITPAPHNSIIADTSDNNKQQAHGNHPQMYKSSAARYPS